MTDTPIKLAIQQSWVGQGIDQLHQIRDTLCEHRADWDALLGKGGISYKQALSHHALGKGGIALPKIPGTSWIGQLDAFIGGCTAAIEAWEKTGRELEEKIAAKEKRMPRKKAISDVPKRAILQDIDKALGERIQNLIDALIEKTRAGEITWNFYRSIHTGNDMYFIQSSNSGYEYRPGHVGLFDLIRTEGIFPGNSYWLSFHGTRQNWVYAGRGVDATGFALWLAIEESICRQPPKEEIDVAEVTKAVESVEQVLGIPIPRDERFENH